VNVPKDFDLCGLDSERNHPRGFFLGLLEYSEDDELISYIREIPQFRKTDGWQLLQFFHRPDSMVHHVRIRLGVSSVGQAFVDDVGIAEVTVP